MLYGYAVEYYKREGYTTYSLVIGDAYGKKRKPATRPQKIKNGVAQEVEVEIGDVMVAVRNSWEMVRERAEIRLYGVKDIVNGEPVVELFDEFDGRYWDNKKHAHYHNLIDLALQSVGRVSMFKKMSITGMRKIMTIGGGTK